MPLQQVTARRLTKLIQFMAKLPREADAHFHMENWMRHEGVDHSHFVVGKPLCADDLMSCGTQACALGWATTIPAFRKAGLSMSWNGHKSVVRFKSQWASYVDVFDIAKSFFHIDLVDARYLFKSIPGKTPRGWAKNAKAWLKKASAHD